MEKKNKRKIWIERNINRIREIKRSWNKRNRKLKAELQKEYCKRHPEVIKAHNYIHNHKITLKNNCEFCNNNFNLEGHHPDYNKPYFIITVCKLCHSKIHYIGGK